MHLFGAAVLHSFEFLFLLFSSFFSVGDKFCDNGLIGLIVGSFDGRRVSVFFCFSEVCLRCRFVLPLFCRRCPAGRCAFLVSGCRCLPLAFLSPIPPPALAERSSPPGKGEIFSFLMQGASPLASPRPSRKQHGLNLRCRCPLGGLVRLVAGRPCRCGVRRGAWRFFVSSLPCL